MIRSPWRLDGNSARLDAPMLQGALRVDRPQDGLTNLVLGEKQRPGDSILAIGTKPADLTVAESYIRGGDLVATYAETGNDRVRPQIYWRSQMTGEGEPSGGVEVVVSMQTSLLDSDPGLTTCSILPAGEILWLEEESLARFRLLTPGEFPSTGTGLVLLRPAGENVSYFEAVCPGDYLGGFWQMESNGKMSRVGLHFRLFGERLEKGVIRRTRVFGGFIPRQDDERMAVACWTNWLAQPLPLTT